MARAVCVLISGVACACASLTDKEPSFVGNVADFLVSNPNKLFTQDMKHGGTPLHWSSSRVVLNSLIERGCDVNLVNFNGQTPLHVMVIDTTFAIFFCSIVAATAYCSLMRWNRGYSRAHMRSLSLRFTFNHTPFFHVHRTMHDIS